MSKTKIVIATIKSWNIDQAKKFQQLYTNKYVVQIITQKEELTTDFLENYQPDYIFFPHWSWIIPAQIYNNFNCIVFHSTDLPFGRGGTPLQNLIADKIYRTKISAIKVEKGLDTGPIYCQIPFSVKTGSAEQLLKRISKIVFTKLIPQIIEEKIQPLVQVGQVTEFKRREPSMSNFSQAKPQSLEDVYDLIRMVDGEGYPPAYIRLNDSMVINFVKVKKTKDGLVGQFKVIYEKE